MSETEISKMEADIAEKENQLKVLEKKKIAHEKTAQKLRSTLAKYKAEGKKALGTLTAQGIKLKKDTGDPAWRGYC